ncbi:hypothetical protein R1flu_015130 [Riccia fluitans]|uniref:Peptide methionine sulfoxide reductase A5 n=1 Tax=Riccia fluitans TaxID=41844 RepID=A0ABD1YLC1_9MARC
MSTGKSCIVARVVIYHLLVIGSVCNLVCGIRTPENYLKGKLVVEKQRKVATFALGSFWRGEAVFGCLPGVVRTRVGYSGGSKINPDYHSISDHAESVEIEYDPSVIRYEQLLDVFWANHDPTQTFGQGPDVGEQYRSIIFTQGDEEFRLAALSKQREQTRLADQMVLTSIRALAVFYPAEAEHQKFVLRRKPLLLQLLGELSDFELMNSTTASKMNSYVAGMCPQSVAKQIEAKIRPLLNSTPKLLRLFGESS